MKHLLFFLLYPYLALGVALKITKVRDLQFSDCTVNEVNEIVPFSSSQSSQFLIKGDPNAEIKIEIPSGTINMSGPCQNVGASGWTSNAGQIAQLDASGNFLVSIGSTRLVPSTSVCRGTYSGVHVLRAKYSSQLFFREQQANHIVKVIQSLSLTKTKDLQFPQGYAGDPSFTIAPTNPDAAQFTITGESGASVQIILPSNGTVLATTAGGGTPEKNIVIENFVATIPLLSTIQGNGTLVFGVGATRRALISTQVDGNYSGQFFIQIIYP